VNAFWLLTKLRIFDVLRSRSSLGFFLALPLLVMIATSFVFKNGHPFERRTLVLVGDVSEPALANVDGLRLERAPSLRVAEEMLRTHIASAVLVRRDNALTLLTTRQERIFAEGLQARARSTEIALLPDADWGYVHYLFPGLLAFTVLFSGLFGTGYTLALYRQNLFLKKLATTPLRKRSFIGALLISRGLLVLVQVALLVLTMVLGFAMPWTVGSMLRTFAVCALGLGTFLGLGFALACLIRGAEILADILSAISAPLVLLSEMFFPLHSLPAPLATLGAALPSTQLVRLLRSVLLYDESGEALWLGMAILGAWALSSFALSFKLFKWTGT
jgi:ABC-2 type transport system permease protein